MTAEIAILNRQAVALAADSAVTISIDGKAKTINSANKIFMLSKYHPVGIMIYNSASVMNFPWETIVKSYRKKLGKKKFNTISQYAQDFIKYIQSPLNLFNSSDQSEWAHQTIHHIYLYILYVIINQVEDLIKNKGAQDQKTIDALVNGIIHASYSAITSGSTDRKLTLSAAKKASMKRDINKISERFKTKFYNKFNLTRRSHLELDKIAESLFFKHVDEEFYLSHTGIVVSGYGEKEYFPALQEFLCFGIYHNCAIVTQVRSRKIDMETSGTVIPFAQKDVIHTFMEGIDPELDKFIYGQTLKLFASIVEKVGQSIPNKTVRQSLDKAITKHLPTEFQNHIRHLEKFKKDSFVHPVLSIVQSLPKDELAAMAESLVTITSFKRRISMDLETVGGPVDVAVISKGDGFVWIKRKHYFPEALNHHFYNNYFTI